MKGGLALSGRAAPTPLHLLGPSCCRSCPPHCSLELWRWIQAMGSLGVEWGVRERLEMRLTQEQW